MLSFSDRPYVFVEPRPCKALIGVLQQINRWVSLCWLRHRITGVTVLNDDRIAPLRRAGSRLLFLPNHSTHSDVEIISEAYRQVGMPSQYMAAYDVFARSRFRSWMMQHGGAFSVDREGSDKQSMKQAIHTLAAGEYGLTIFPEGNIHFTNELVTPFLDGAAFIGLRAQAELPPEDGVYIVPIGIKVSYTTDQCEAVRQRLNALAQRVGTSVANDDGIVGELSRIGRLLLQTRLPNRPGLEFSGNSDLKTLLEGTAAAILNPIEGSLDIAVKSSDSLLERARRVRREIHQTRLGMGDGSRRDIADAVADEAMLALRILHYNTDYVSSSPTLDRVAETVEKLREDMDDKLHFATAPRHAFVSFGSPIAVADFAAARTREAVAGLTAAAEKGVQAELDALVAANPHPGGQLFR